jgi:hypothetical protein
MRFHHISTTLKSVYSSPDKKNTTGCFVSFFFRVKVCRWVLWIVGCLYTSLFIYLISLVDWAVFMYLWIVDCRLFVPRVDWAMFMYFTLLLLLPPQPQLQLHTHKQTLQRIVCTFHFIHYAPLFLYIFI